jgi:hypothetical protein
LLNLFVTLLDGWRRYELCIYLLVF